MNDDYYKAVEKLSKLYDELLNFFPEEKKSAFKELCEAYDELDYQSSNDYFTKGLKLGILLGIEVCN